MSTAAAESAREIVRIAANAGLAKDTVAIMEKKAAALAEQISTQERELASLRGTAAH